MAVAFASAGAGAAGTATSLAVPYPATVASGDLLYLHVMNQSNVETVDTPTGFTLVDFLDWQDGENHVYALYRRVADGSETGNLTVTTSDATSGIFGRIYRFTGVDGTTPHEAYGPETSFGSTTVSDKDLTTLGANRLACQFIAVSANEAQSAFTGETGGDWTEALAEYTSATGSGASLGLQTAAVAAAGSIGGGSFTIVSGVDTNVMGLALIPATAGTNATVTGVAAAASAAVSAPPKPRPAAPFSEINVRL